MLTKYFIYGLMFTSALGYFSYSQSVISKLTTETATLSQEVKNRDSLILELQSFMRRQQLALEDYNKALKDSNTVSSSALKILEEHDLEELSKRKPSLIEKRVNKATTESFEELKNVTNN